MNIDERILAIKSNRITDRQKLVLILIVERSVPIIGMGCDYSAGEIASALGLTRNEVLDILDDLLELDFIVTNVFEKSRSTMITPRFKKLLEPEVKTI